MAAITFRFPGADNPDFAAAQILSDVLSSQRGKLYGLVPEGKALFAEFSYDTLPKSGLGYAIAGFPAGGGFDQSAGTSTRNSGRGNHQRRHRRSGGSRQTPRNHQRRIAKKFRVRASPPRGRTPSPLKAAIRRTTTSTPFRQVTVADVNRVAKKYLDFDHAITRDSHAAPSDKPISSKSFGGRRIVCCPRKTPMSNCRPGRKRSPKQLPFLPSTLNPFVTNLPNGIKLIVQPESISDTVSVYGRVKNNPKVQMPAGKDGVDQALDNFFPTAPNRWTGWRSKRRWTTSARTNQPARIFRCRCCPTSLNAACNCSRTMNFPRRCPKTISKSSSRNSPRSVAGEMQSPDHIAGHALHVALVSRRRSGAARNHARHHQITHDPGREKLLSAPRSGPT